MILDIPVTPPYHVKFSHQIIVFTVKFDFVDLFFSKFEDDQHFIIPYWDFLKNYYLFFFIIIYYLLIGKTYLATRRHGDPKARDQ